MAKTVIFDNGSSAMRAGFAGDSAPKADFPMLIGRPRQPGSVVELPKDFYIGSEAQTKRGILSLKYPIEHGDITSWDDMEKIWDYTFNEMLQVSPSDQPVLMSERPDVPKMNKEKILQVMFETFDIPSIALVNKATLGLYATGKLNGMLIDSGDSVTHFVPVIDGYSVPEATLHTDYGGRSLDMYMSKLLGESTPDLKYNDAQAIKEQFSYIALDFDAEMKKNTEEKEYGLPDGSKIKVNKERFRCPEALFKPELMGQEMPGIHKIIHNSIRKVTDEAQNLLLKNIVLIGGNTLFEGISERLHTQLTSLFPPGTEIDITARPERLHSVWIGGSILASLPTFPDICTTKEEYDEHGPSIVHKKIVNHKANAALKGNGKKEDYYSNK